MEIWKDIEGYEGYYQVSNLGNVKNVRNNNILKGDLNSTGYRRVTLNLPNKKRFFIHKLVALYFCDGYEEGLVVNHKDGNKTNNSADNLEWVTRSENDLHAFRNNLRKAYPCTFKHKILMFNKQHILIKEFDNVQECCEYLKVKRSQVYNCCNKKAYTCKGYILEYKK